MVKVKYWDNIEPMTFEENFETEEEACKWIERQMSEWYEMLCNEYPDSDVTWLNRLLDVGDVTEIYIPNTSISIMCEFIR